MKKYSKEKLVMDLRKASSSSSPSPEFEAELLRNLNKELKPGYFYFPFFELKHLAPLFLFVAGLFVFSPLLFIDSNNSNSKQFSENAVEESADFDDRANAPYLNMGEDSSAGTIAMDLALNVSLTEALSCIEAEGDEVIIENNQDYQNLLNTIAESENCSGYSLPDIDFKANSLVGKNIRTSGCSINSYSQTIENPEENTIVINVDKFGDCDLEYNKMNWFLVNKEVLSRNFRIKVQENFIE